MIESLYADIGWQSLTKSGQIVCGDHVEKIQRPDGSREKLKKRSEK